MRRVVVWIWQFIKIYFFLIGVFFSTAIITLFLLLSSLDLDFFSNSHSQIELTKPEGDFMVEVDLDGNVYDHFDHKSTDGLLSLLSESETFQSVKGLQEIIGRLKTEDAVKGVLFHIRPTYFIHSNYAMDILDNLQNLAEEKPVYFFGSVIRGSANYLIGTGEKIVLAPGGDILLPSPTMQFMLIGKLMERFGVGVDVLKAGEFKSLIFNLKQMDKGSRKQMLSIYDSLLASHKQMMQISRPMVTSETDDSPAVTVERIAQWFENSHYNHKDALNNKLVTEISHLEPFKDSVEAVSELPWHDYEKVNWKDLEGERPPKQEVDEPNSVVDSTDAQGEGSGDGSSSEKTVSKDGSHDKGFHLSQLFSDHKDASNKNKSIGYLSFAGSIALDNGGSQGGVITDTQVEEQVDKMIEHKHVKAVVVRINSPGGGVMASELIWSHIKRLSDKKPVVAYIDSMAASGGYYMASAADKIVSRGTAITGSIGVLFVRGHMAGIAEKYGIISETITRENHSDLYDFTKELSTETKGYYQDQINDAYELFIKRVADGRNLSPDVVHTKLAQGRIWTGDQALQNSLVDALGDRSIAFSIAKKLAGLDTSRGYPLVFYEEKTHFLKTCLDSPTKCLRMLDSRLLTRSLPLFGHELLYELLSPDLHHRLLSAVRPYKHSVEMIQAHLWYESEALSLAKTR